MDSYFIYDIHQQVNFLNRTIQKIIYFSNCKKFKESGENTAKSFPKNL